MWVGFDYFIAYREFFLQIKAIFTFEINVIHTSVHIILIFSQLGRQNYIFIAARIILDVPLRRSYCANQKSVNTFDLTLT